MSVPHSGSVRLNLEKCLARSKTLTRARPGEGGSRGTEPLDLPSPGPWCPRLKDPEIFTPSPCPALGFLQFSRSHVYLPWETYKAITHQPFLVYKLKADGARGLHLTVDL